MEKVGRVRRVLWVESVRAVGGECEEAAGGEGEAIHLYSVH